MEILYWLIIVGFFLLSFIGLIFPIIPSVLVLWGGFLVYRFLISPDELSLFFWITMAVLTIFMFFVDFIASRHFVKKSGGSRRGEWAGILGIIIGAFIYPPFGLIIVPFIAVYAVELTQEKSSDEALKIALGTIAGFLSSTIAKAVIQLGMIGFFVVEVIF
ncbi:DUF456 domain-containing protein [Caldalkalibacillus salinus]|uniref:DUF456 domain-containing protein n=1 Tax=Caldalkalibacillus salinus TaxID=2803787 RepID=UPI0019226FE3|nr:DUF456 domain-containing protein [Caldalkalibacillus salinus]